MLLYFKKTHKFILLYFWNNGMGEIFIKANKKKMQIQMLVSIRKIVERI